MTATTGTSGVRLLLRVVRCILRGHPLVGEWTTSGWGVPERRCRCGVHLAVLIRKTEAGR